MAEATFRDELAPANPDQALRHQTVYPAWMPGEREIPAVRFGPLHSHRTTAAASMQAITRATGHE